MSAWISIEHAPRNGTLVDLWGYDRDPDPNAAGILLPISLSLGRYTDCSWRAPMIITKTGLLMPMAKNWYQRNEAHDGDREEGWRRIWPTHFMLIPEGPQS